MFTQGELRNLPLRPKCNPKTQKLENNPELDCHATTKECWGSPQEYNTFVRFENSDFVLKIEVMRGEFDELDCKALRKRLEQKVGRNIRLRLVFPTTLFSALYLDVFCVLYNSTEHMQSRVIPYLLSRRDEYVTTSFARKDSELTHISQNP